MFTGIIEENGTIKSIKMGLHSSSLCIAADIIFSDLKIGDSVAVNGVCLTVTSIHGKVFNADVMHETLKRSSLGNLKISEKVNLERAMSVNDRFGGHIVSGHIDGTGIISKITKDDIADIYEINTKSALIDLIIEKGSVTIDGISLTVSNVSDNSFMVSVIPHTKQCTTLASKKIGDIVNIENDVIGKYIKSFLSTEKTPKSNITREFLYKQGF